MTCPALPPAWPSVNSQPEEAGSSALPGSAELPATPKENAVTASLALLTPSWGWEESEGLYWTVGWGSEKRLAVGHEGFWSSSWQRLAFSPA